MPRRVLSTRAAAAATVTPARNDSGELPAAAAAEAAEASLRRVMTATSLLARHSRAAGRAPPAATMPAGLPTPAVPLPASRTPATGRRGITRVRTMRVVEEGEPAAAAGSAAVAAAQPSSSSRRFLAYRDGGAGGGGTGGGRRVEDVWAVTLADDLFAEPT